MSGTDARPRRWRRRLAWSVGLAAAALVAGAIRHQWRQSPAAVVLITVDTLRGDFLWGGGGFATETPFLDRLAAGGVVFDAAYAASSWTAPSMASLFTSLPPSAHGVTSGLIHDEHVLQQRALSPSLTTLAESLHAGGFVTIGMPANLHLSHEFGFAQGFDYFAGRARFVDARRLNHKVQLALADAFGTQWRRAWTVRPTFLWVHYFDPHFPYTAREPWASRAAPDSPARTVALPSSFAELQRQFPHPTPADVAPLVPVYASEISYLDDQLRRLSDRLGLEADNVLLVVTADHGEEFAEHGALGHGHSLYEELVHVPLLIRWPAVIPGGRRIATPVSLLDLYPTLLDLVGLREGEGLLGRSRAGVLRGDAAPDSQPVFTDLLPPHEDLRAVRDGRWKRIQRRDGSGGALYDLVADPGERRDVTADHPDDARRLDALLAARAASLPPPPDDDNETHIPDDAATRERLRALGYSPDP